MGIVVFGAVFVDIKGFPDDIYIPDGRNVGHVEYIHGGVSRNVVEDIANIELRPTFVSIVDDSALGQDVVRKLNNHKVNTDYVLTIPGGMGTWLAVFDHSGNLAGSISQRPNLMPILDLLEEKGDEIFANADSVIVEVDMDRDAVYADLTGDKGICPPQKVRVKDTTGAGDAFCAGVSSGLTYGKTLREAVEIGSRLAASVITSLENVCPRFLPEEFGIQF